MIRRHSLVALLVLGVLGSGCPLGRGSKKLGDECKDNNQCEKAHCESGICTNACKTDAECATPKLKLTCVIDPSPTNTEKYGICKKAP
jgi:hypothetical protein